MGAFSYHRFIFLLTCIDCRKVYNRLVSACTVKAAIAVQRLCVSTSRKLYSCRAASVPTSFLPLQTYERNCSVSVDSIIPWY